jgi:predicted metal-binding membrane protein
MSRGDRALVAAAVIVLTALAWWYLVDMAGAMRAPMSGMGAPTMFDIPALFIMWAVMMVGMMLPGATPMIMLFAAINRQKRKIGSPFVPTAIFVLGYVVAWTAFSLIAAAVQSQLHALALLSPEMMSTSRVLGGMLFVLAGVYQWTPLKHACLRTCRSPLDFVLNRWREGSVGALRMGLEHGLYCVGCCWFLMGLLFAVGVMNLLWLAAIAVLVLAEKLLPGGPRIANASGVLMIGAGVFLFAGGFAG